MAFPYLELNNVITISREEMNAIDILSSKFAPIWTLEDEINSKWGQWVIEMKKCSNCGEEHPIYRFPPSSKPTLYKSRCKVCTRVHESSKKPPIISLITCPRCWQRWSQVKMGIVHPADGRQFPFALRNICINCNIDLHLVTGPQFATKHSFQPNMKFKGPAAKRIKRV